MGIGFKAVFHSFQTADVSSGIWRFRFRVPEVVGEYGDRQRDWLGSVLPEYSDEIPPPSVGMRCRFLLHDRLQRLGAPADDVGKVLSDDWVLLALLARRQVKEVDWNGHRWMLGQKVEAAAEGLTRLKLEALDEQSGDVRQWILFAASHQPSREAVARFLEHRQIRPKPETKGAVYTEASRQRSVELFCPLNDSGFPTPPTRGEAYALLGTGVALPLGAHIQADWLLVTSRRELMELETNAWHCEILAIVPILIRAYLCWVSTPSVLQEQQLPAAYTVLPDFGEDGGEFGKYFRRSAFTDQLRSALSDLPFLPVRGPEGLVFVDSTAAQILPVPLRIFDDRSLHPWELFGHSIISTRLLGAKGLRTLEELGILQTLAPDDLARRWSLGGVGRWREVLGESGAAAHLKLIRALSMLDAEPKWRGAHFSCLPSTAGGWISRDEATVLPLDWDTVPQNDPQLQELLQPFLPDPVSRLDWTFDRTLQRDQDARQYISAVNRDKLEDVMSRWWAALPATPDSETCEQILDASCWVVAKQRQRPALVRRVLCQRSGSTALVPFADAVVAEPYACWARRRFFPQKHSVSDRYLHHRSGLSDADWRSFFEGGEIAISGPFQFVERVRELSNWELCQAMPDGYTPPLTKAGRMTARWGRYSFSSHNYLLVDRELPSTLVRILKGPATTRESEDVITWLSEGRASFSNAAHQQVMYVAYNTSSVFCDTTAFSASWVQCLNDAAWLYASDGTGPFTPLQILPCPDPARPGSPAAQLPPELVDTLRACGIAFGADVPEVTSVERLSRQGLSAELQRVVDLIAAAIDEVGEDADGKAALRRIINERAIIPLPVGASPLDGSSRISGTRLVRRATRGSDLGGWLVSCETIRDESGNPEVCDRLFQLIEPMCEIPNTATWEQAMQFLHWIWHATPDADLVRRTLARAYRLVSEELDRSDDHQAFWEATRLEAAVYVGSRKWVAVASERVYLDDLGDENLKPALVGLELATPGHLGETLEEQKQIATLLALPRLSEKYRIDIITGQERTFPPDWADRFKAIAAFVLDYRLDEDPLADEADHEPGRFGTDIEYREAAMEHERRHGRYPEAKDPDQAGYDIDSFNRPSGDPFRKLVRRIEVKGRSSPWTQDQTVELSGRQFQDARNLRVDEDDFDLANDFDYWLYVVEPKDDRSLDVLAIRNPAARAAKFEFRGGTWRDVAERIHVGSCQWQTENPDSEKGLL